MGVTSKDFLSGRGSVWPALRKAATQAVGPAYVAVAYFGIEGPKWLPLKPGSYLVVDASEKAVKSGQTHPASLMRMQRRGILIYSVPGLHAKVFVFGSVAYVGSTNVSGHSANGLIEAVVVARQRSLVAHARQFVRKHCVGLVGPEELKKLQKMYRKPLWFSKNDQKSASRALRVVRLKTYEPPDFLEQERGKARSVARRQMEAPTLHELDDFDWSGNHTYVKGDWLLRITKEANNKILVSPPSRVTHLRRVRRAGKAKTIVFVEAPKRRRKSLELLTKQLGRGAKKLLGTKLVLRDTLFVDRIFESFQA